MAKGWKMTEESKLKVSLSKKGKKPNLTDEVRSKKRLIMLGNKYAFFGRGVKKKGHVAWNKGLIGFMSGEKSGRWIKDRTKVVGRHNRNFHDSDYRQWVKGVYTRDDFRCKISNKDCSGRIEAHHILGWKNYPELRYKLNNGITLCHFHHPRKRDDEKKLSPYFQSMVAEMNNIATSKTITVARQIASDKSANSGTFISVTYTAEPEVVDGVLKSGHLRENPGVFTSGTASSNYGGANPNNDSING